MKLRPPLVAVLLALPLLAAAQTSTPRVDARQQRQETRIEQGTASGALTPREADRLERGQAQIDRAENRAMADGKVGPRERARLEHLQDQQSRRIAREKHDRQTDLNHDGRNDPNPRAEARRERAEARRERAEARHERVEARHERRAERRGR